MATRKPAPRVAASRRRFIATIDELPLLVQTPEAWARLAFAELPRFLSDHAICEQQAALFALNLVAHYPDDFELVERMTELAAEEVTHLRRVASLMHRRGLRLARRRPNPYAQALHGRIERESERRLKIDRLLVGALIEARSCERFTRLLAVAGQRDEELAELLFDLGPAERRHWELFHGLARREADAGWFDGHWRGWLEFEGQLMQRRGRSPAVHG